MLQVVWVTDMGSAKSYWQTFIVVAVICHLCKYPHWVIWRIFDSSLHFQLRCVHNIVNSNPVPYFSAGEQWPLKEWGPMSMQRLEAWWRWSVDFPCQTLQPCPLHPSMWWNGYDRDLTSLFSLNLDPTHLAFIHITRVSFIKISNHASSLFSAVFYCHCLKLNILVKSVALFW